MEGDCNVYAHSSLWMRPTGEWSINAKMVYRNGWPNTIILEWRTTIILSNASPSVGREKGISLGGIFWSAKEGFSSFWGVRRLRRKEGVIAGGQRSELKPRIFNHPFLLLNLLYSATDTFDKKGGLKIWDLSLDLWPPAITPSFLLNLLTPKTTKPLFC